jgi:sigma-B regulation protein RsbU (phosphoserine phosphatase)
MSAVARLLAPGVAIMNRLRYPQKFLLITLLFAIPLGLTMSLWLAELGGRIAFARKERRGLEYLAAARGVMEPLARLPALERLGAPAAARRLEDERARIAAAVRALHRVDGRLGDELGATDQWRALAPRA